MCRALAMLPETYQKWSLPKVGVFVNASCDTIQSTIKAYGLEKVQLHGDESPQQVEEIKRQLDVELIKVFRIGVDWSWKGFGTLPAPCGLFSFLIPTGLLSEALVTVSIGNC